MAVVPIHAGETEVQTSPMILVSAAHSRQHAVGWASGRFDPVAWMVLALLLGSGIYWFCKPPPE
jgi:hypothetical protein